MHDPLRWIDDELCALKSRHLLREQRTFVGPRGAVVVHDGRELINFGSNDYLNLAGDPRLATAVTDAVACEGWGAGASPLVTGHAETHRLLERRLAEFEGTEAAMLFSSGFAANTGAIAALAGAGDAVFSDERNHASIIDGCRLSRAQVFIYRHGDVDHLRELLRENCPRKRGQAPFAHKASQNEPVPDSFQADDRNFRRLLIVTDTVFSMGGDFAPLAPIAELAHEFGAMLAVDEAHATGVFGKHGRGLCEELNLEGAVHVRIGTLSKALGSGGGFVAGARPLIDWLVNRSRSYVFSTAQPAACSAAAIRALDIVCDEPRRREELLARAAELRRVLREQGWNIGSSESQIVPIIVGDAGRTMEIAARLKETGLLVPGIRPPSVPADESLLRISLTVGHTAEMVERLVVELGRV